MMKIFLFKRFLKSIKTIIVTNGALMLSVIYKSLTLSAAMLNVVVLTFVMLSVVAPSQTVEENTILFKSNVCELASSMKKNNCKI